MLSFIKPSLGVLLLGFFASYSLGVIVVEFLGADTTFAGLYVMLVNIPLSSALFFTVLCLGVVGLVVVFTGEPPAYFRSMPEERASDIFSAAFYAVIFWLGHFFYLLSYFADPSSQSGLISVVQSFGLINCSIFFLLAGWGSALSYSPKKEVL